VRGDRSAEIHVDAWLVRVFADGPAARRLTNLDRRRRAEGPETREDGPGGRGRSLCLRRRLRCVCRRVGRRLLGSAGWCGGSGPRGGDVAAQAVVEVATLVLDELVGLRPLHVRADLLVP